jgi:MFS family permease
VLGDKYGRLKISKIGFLLACGLYLLYFIPLVYPILVIYMFLFGFINAYYIQAYILGVEFTSNENRDFYTIVAQSTDGFFGLVTVVVYCFTNNFHIFISVGLAIGIIITIFMFLFIPESPRFYVATGRPKEAMKVYKYLAKLHPNP